MQVTLLRCNQSRQAICPCVGGSGSDAIETVEGVMAEGYFAV